MERRRRGAIIWLPAWIRARLKVKKEGGGKRRRRNDSPNTQDELFMTMNMTPIGD
jgi:hypothetical protein